MIEPSAAILAFIERQAEPVRGNIFYHIAAACVPNALVNPDAVPQLARDFLSVSSSACALYRTTMAIGALDFGFSLPLDTSEKYYADLPEAVRQHPNVQPFILQAPLNRRYLEQAAAEWAKLRASTLSHAALCEYLTKHSEAWVTKELGV